MSFRTAKPVNTQLNGQKAAAKLVQRRTESAAPQAANHPGRLNPRTVLGLQGAAGNQVVARMLAQKAIQAKLTVGAANDGFEQEADRVAQQVMSPKSEAEVQRTEEDDTLQAKPLAASISSVAQRKSGDGEEQAAGGAFEAGAGFEARLKSSQGGGQAMPGETREFMENRFGADFSGVRLHTDSSAAQLSRDVQAQAFTHGQDIYLGEGKYNPQSETGKALLAHELTHTIQQGGAQVKNSSAVQGKAVGTPVLQRLMAVDVATTRISPKSVNKAGMLFGTKKSTDSAAYNLNRESMLRYLQSVHEEISGSIAATVPALKSQLTAISRAYDGLVASLDLLLQKLDSNRDDPRYLAALELRVQATNEKSQIIRIFMQNMANPRGRRGGAPTVVSLMNVNVNYTMNSALKNGTVGGGMNTLTKYRNMIGTNDYFKPNSNSIDHYDSLEEADNTEGAVFGEIVNKLMELTGRLIDSAEAVINLPMGSDAGVDYKQFGNRDGFARAFGAHKKRGVNTEFKEHAGINLNDLRSSNREVAMSRLDMLLDANLISKAQLAIEKNGLKATPKLGSVAGEAKGKDITKYNLVADQANHPGTRDTVRRDDPVLLSKLSALQMIDFLAGQVDRHQGNYMIQVDNNGAVVNITGIDNDMSFGTKDTNLMATRGARQLPILAKYFDSDMANKILRLDADMVRIALSDLLTPEEINSTLERLALLKRKLSEAQNANQLLNPGQWANMFTTQVGRSNFAMTDYTRMAAGRG
jgi:hypothetical protein